MSYFAQGGGVWTILAPSIVFWQYGQTLPALRFTPAEFLPQELQWTWLHFGQIFQELATPQNGHFPIVK